MPLNLSSKNTPTLYRIHPLHNDLTRLLSDIGSPLPSVLEFYLPLVTISHLFEQLVIFVHGSLLVGVFWRPREALPSPSTSISCALCLLPPPSNESCKYMVATLQHLHFLLSFASAASPSCAEKDLGNGFRVYLGFSPNLLPKSLKMFPGHNMVCIEQAFML